MHDITSDFFSWPLKNRQKRTTIVISEHLFPVTVNPEIREKQRNVYNHSDIGTFYVPVRIASHGRNISNHFTFEYERYE